MLVHQSLGPGSTVYNDLHTCIFQGDSRQGLRVQIKGERLYKAARRGEVVERQSRPVTIHSFELRRDEENRQDVHFRVACSKGTYIRSLAHDLVSGLSP